jgi:pSer/pThr/pTyr-binding forkhead associated (FHA) protein
VNIVLRGEDGSEYTIVDGAILGRVESADIVISDPKVSRQHAKFAAQDGRFGVEDLGSSNGTKLNGQKISGSVELSHGDTLSIEHIALRVIIDGAELEDDDATVIGLTDDATVIGQAAPDLSAVPGSWVESESADSTQFMVAGAESSEVSVPRQSLEPHLILLDEQGGIAEALGLEGSSGEQTWEIGRAEQCDIQLSEPTVSSRHAQLVCEGGKWRVVNLVSSNGILVNGEKRLSAYLADGDLIGLGRAKLVFYSSSSTSNQKDPNPKEDSAGGSSGSKVGVIVAVLVIVIAVIAAL